MKKVLNIEMWMLLVIVLLTACSDHSGEGSDEKDDCFLNIYVYAPGHPMLTRADVGEIAHREIAESTVQWARLRIGRLQNLQFTPFRFGCSIIVTAVWWVIWKQNRRS